MFLRLLFLFILVPIIELSLFMALGRYLGLLPTLVIILLTGFLGAVLTKSQGSKALANFTGAMAIGQMPHREIVDGLLILIAGAVLLTPGFLTDAIGFALLVPPLRAMIRGILSDRLALSIQKQVAAETIPADEGGTAKPASGKVIDV